MNIPFVDLKANYKSFKREIDEAIKKVIASSSFILGSEVEKFERDFANYCGCKYAVGLDNGSSALELGMRALGIREGDEIITPANSFIASSSAITFVGAKPVWVDVDINTYNIDPKLIEKKISKKTKAIMPVHLYGQPADIDSIMKIAKKYKLMIIEDACQAHGAVYKGRKVGSFGDFAAFSFYPSKNLGAFGDAGVIVTNSKDLYEKVATMRNYGQSKKHFHDYLAWNRRTDGIQAAILNVKLKFLNKCNNLRRKNAKIYYKYLKNLPVVTPSELDFLMHVYHLYVIRARKRDQLVEFLRKKGIATGIHYPIPIHLQKAYRFAGFKKGSFPVTEKLSKEVVSLPMYPELGEIQIKYVSRCIGDFFNKN